MTIRRPVAWYIKTILLTLALGIMIGQVWHELASVPTLILALVFACAGYGFGKITCAEHNHPGRGILASVSLFIFLNGLHSIIDGVSFATSSVSWFSIAAHEIVRQLAMYAVILGMLMPFRMHPVVRYVGSFAAVTLVWLLGMALGDQVAQGLTAIAWIHPYLAAGAFLLVGDIIHHIIDEYRHPY